MIRWAPIKAWEGFSLQSSFSVPLGENLQGSNDSPFIDWDGYVFWTQFFYDKSLGDKFSIFFEADVLFEDIGAGESNRLTVPLSTIISYFPHKKVTLYTLLNVAPTISSPTDYFYQIGGAVKYQITPNFEIELTASHFRNQFLIGDNGRAATYNIGFRYSR